MKARRVLKDVDVRYISLVGKGANNKTIIWKSEAGSGAGEALEREVRIVKVDEDKRLVYGVVYAPDEVDAHGDLMSADEIEKMAYRFMQHARTDKVDKEHDEKADEGFVAESWIVKDKDATFPDEKTGAWAVGIKVTDESTWKLVKSGKIGGISMGGFAKAEPVAEEAGQDGMLKRFFKQLFGYSEGVEKDFAASFNSRVFRDAIWGLNDSLLETLRDDKVSEKRAALVQNCNQFISFINGLKEVPVMEGTDKKLDKADGAAEQQAADTEVKKADAQATEQQDIAAQLAAVSKTLEALAGRLEKIEKAHGGSQAEKAHGDDGESVKKEYKGIRFV